MNLKLIATSLVVAVSLARAAYAGCYCDHVNQLIPGYGGNCTAVGMPTCQTTFDSTSCFVNGFPIIVMVYCPTGAEFGLPRTDCTTDDGGQCPPSSGS